jgi:hypothetical protein
VSATKEQFAAYIRVQISGVTNMFDVNTVKALSGLNREQILDIMEHYAEYCKQYPDVAREAGVIG